MYKNLFWGILAISISTSLVAFKPEPREEVSVLQGVEMTVDQMLALFRYLGADCRAHGSFDPRNFLEGGLSGEGLYIALLERLYFVLETDEFCRGIMLCCHPQDRVEILLCCTEQCKMVWDGRDEWPAETSRARAEVLLAGLEKIYAAVTADQPDLSSWYPAEFATIARVYIQLCAPIYRFLGSASAA